METLEGVIINGGIVLSPPRALPEGARVKVSIEELAAPRSTISDVIDQAIEHRRQHGGRTKQEIDAELAELRDDAEREIQESE